MSQVKVTIFVSLLHYDHHFQRPFAPTLLHALAAGFFDPSFSSHRACVVLFPSSRYRGSDLSQKAYRCCKLCLR
jgi:hypothetical protein